MQSVSLDCYPTGSKSDICKYYQSLDSWPCCDKYIMW